MKLPKLTKEQAILKAKIEKLQQQIRSLSAELGKTASRCEKVGGHVIVPRDLEIDEKLKTDKWASTSASCLICGLDFGWWCPKSPDHICHYSKTDDSCDYCGMPNERK